MTTTEDAALDARTRAWLSALDLDGGTVRTAATLRGGFTNDMLLLTTEAGRRYVLRRYRASATRARRNPCAVEGAVLRHVTGRVPVARLLAADPEGAGTGGPVLLYEYVEGEPLSEVLAPGRLLAAEEVVSLGRAVGAALAALASVRFPAAGYFTDDALLPVGPGPETGPALPAHVERCLDARSPHSPLTADDLVILRELTAKAAELTEKADGAGFLVHNDFNPKNLLVRRDAGQWAVAAVLDWEQAYSGSPLVDLGNMLRFEHLYPAAFGGAVVEGFREAGGELPAAWRVLSRALDLVTLADILTSPPDEELFARARSVLLRDHAVLCPGGNSSPYRNASPSRNSSPSSA